MSGRCARIISTAVAPFSACEIVPTAASLCSKSSNRCRAGNSSSAINTRIFSARFVGAGLAPPSLPVTIVLRSPLDKEDRPQLPSRRFPDSESQIDSAHRNRSPQSSPASPPTPILPTFANPIPPAIPRHHQPRESSRAHPHAPPKSPPSRRSPAEKLRAVSRSPPTAAKTTTAPKQFVPPASPQPQPSNALQTESSGSQRSAPEIPSPRPAALPACPSTPATTAANLPDARSSPAPAADRAPPATKSYSAH